LARLAEAMAELDAAIQLADQMEYQPIRWGARSRLAALLAEAGDGRRAEALRAEAKDIVQGIGAGLSDERLRETFLAAQAVRAILSG